MPAASRRSADDWLDAACARFRQGGLAAVRVEAVARDLGATKGSFYWHFADRRALVNAVVARWEAEQADRATAATTTAGPRLRLARLLSGAGEPDHRGEDHLFLEAAAEGVQDAVARVAEHRTAAVAAALVDLGAHPGDAHQRASLALAASLGLDQLARVGAVDSSAERARLVLRLVDLLAPPG